jgi:hypothetical protein
MYMNTLTITTIMVVMIVVVMIMVVIMMVVIVGVMMPSIPPPLIIVPPLALSLPILNRHTNSLPLDTASPRRAHVRAPPPRRQGHWSRAIHVSECLQLLARGDGNWDRNFYRHGYHPLALDNHLTISLSSVRSASPSPPTPLRGVNIHSDDVNGIRLGRRRRRRGENNHGRWRRRKLDDRRRRRKCKHGWRRRRWFDDDGGRGRGCWDGHNGGYFAADGGAAVGEGFEVEALFGGAVLALVDWTGEGAAHCVALE